jgi:hypothetical protein
MCCSEQLQKFLPLFYRRCILLFLDPFCGILPHNCSLITPMHIRNSPLLSLSSGTVHADNMHFGTPLDLGECGKEVSLKYCAITREIDETF